MPNIDKQQTIVVPYCEGQNCPSEPIPRIVTIPTTVGRDKAIRQLFVNTFYENEPEEAKDAIIKEKTEFGAIQISDGICYLFFTIIEEQT